MTLRLLINGSDPQSFKVVRTHHFPGNISLELQQTSRSLLPGEARNYLLKNSPKSGWVCFLDDDAFVAPDYFEQFLNTLRSHPHARVIGGPNLTPKASNSFQLCAGWLLESPLVSGPFSNRYKNSGLTREASLASLILCNCFIYWDRICKFPNRIICGEELVILSKMNPLVHNPQLIVFHERRQHLWAHSKQLFKYGVGRGEALSNRELLAAAAFVGSIVWWARQESMAWAWAWALALYFAYSLISASLLAHKNTKNLIKSAIIFPSLCLLIITHQISYLMGVIFTLFLRPSRAGGDCASDLFFRLKKRSFDSVLAKEEA